MGRVNASWAKLLKSLSVSTSVTVLVSQSLCLCLHISLLLCHCICGSSGLWLIYKTRSLKVFEDDSYLMQIN